MRLSVLALICAAACAHTAANAQVSVNINVPGLISVAPPPPRYERAPPPRSGRIWAPGHWQWQQNAYAWRPGHWERARPDHVYAPGRWVRAGDGWRWDEPSWRSARAHRQEDRRERRHDRHRDDHDDRRDGFHCPPGQAKKGRC